MSSQSAHSSSFSSSKTNKANSGKANKRSKGKSSKKQLTLIRTPNASDVLFGRGGGTNVHVGNKIFRDLINAHRRSYLKAKKNNKPYITQSILRVIRDQHGGRFLKKATVASGGGSKKKTKSNDAADDDDDDESDVHDSLVGTGWYEVDDNTAKEKISQALRQRAPELKK